MKPEITREYFNNGNVWLEEYRINGKLYREDGPARICYYSNKNVKWEEYFINNKRHRIDGPAIIDYNRDGSIKYESCWIKGKCCTKKEFLNSDEYNKWLIEQEILKELT